MHNHRSIQQLSCACVLRDIAQLGIRRTIPVGHYAGSAAWNMFHCSRGGGVSRKKGQDGRRAFPPFPRIRHTLTYECCSTDRTFAARHRQMGGKESQHDFNGELSVLKKVLPPADELVLHLHRCLQGAFGLRCRQAYNFIMNRQKRGPPAFFLHNRRDSEKFSPWSLRLVAPLMR